MLDLADFHLVIGKLEPSPGRSVGFSH